MSNMPINHALMSDIETRYQSATGLASRTHYSIFYGPLRRSDLLVINANPGGTPENFRIVDVRSGQHEYIEGRASGPTTRNGAEILQAIVGSDDPEAIRPIQVLNRFFRRSAGRPTAAIERRYMEEARPFLTELIRYIDPKAILFGGDAGASLLAKAHDGVLTPGLTISGPNGANDAIYYREYELMLPYLTPVKAYGIYHPSKLNGAFRTKVFPLLGDRIGPLLR